MRKRLLIMVAFVTMAFATQNAFGAESEKDKPASRGTQTVQHAFERIKKAYATVKVEKTLQVVIKCEWPVFNDVLDTFSVAPYGNEFILSGTIVSDNTGSGTPFVPVFFGSSLHLPILAGLTNSDGEFRFLMRMPQKGEGKPRAYYDEPTAIDLNDATIYVGGRFTGNESKFYRAKMISCDTYIYPVSELLTPESEGAQEEKSSTESADSIPVFHQPNAVR